MIDKTDSATAQPMDEILDPFGEAWLIAEYRKTKTLNAELLEALEEWANCMPVLCDDLECPDCSRVRRTRELIAKAKGEEK